MLNHRTTCSELRGHGRLEILVTHVACDEYLVLEVDQRKERCQVLLLLAEVLADLCAYLDTALDELGKVRITLPLWTVLSNARVTLVHAALVQRIVLHLCD